MKSRLYSSFLLAATLALLFSLAARGADENTNTIKFSDPSKPGTVKINLGRGELRIQGTDTNEVSVKSDVRISSKPRKDGLRELTASATFALSEKDNVVTLDGMQGFTRGGSDFRLTVPRNTSIIVQNALGGDFTCSGIDGDIEINSMHGEIKLDDVSGGIVVGTMNGEVRANLRQVQEGKPISITSMNGEVQIRLPENAKANVKFRTQNGTVLTDFDEKVLVTKTEASPAKSSMSYRGSSGKVLSVEIEEAIREASRVSATAVREALEAVRTGLAQSRLDQDDARRQVEQAKRDIERARREVDRERNVVVSRSREAVPATPVAPAMPAAPTIPGSPAAPKPPALPKVATVPTIIGGKTVTGTLNGGGPEISVATMNGDVVLRKLEQK